MIMLTIKILLRVFAVLLIGLVSAVIGFIAGLVIGGTLAGIVELVFGYVFVFNGREGYEATGPLSFILGAVTGLVAGGVLLFGRRTKKWLLTSS